jgi:hypothetical protein
MWGADGNGGWILNENSDKIILDLCGGTGAWSKPYKDAGYDVRLLTLPKWDVTRCGFNEFDFEIWMPGGGFSCAYIPYEKIYGIFAAPPCTEFSRAKANNPRDFEAGMEVVSACMEIIWECRIKTKLKFWAMENPVGFLRQFLGKPAYTFQHWQYGEQRSKPTDVWGYFNEPKPTVKEKPADMMYKFPNGSLNAKDWKHPKCPDEYKHLNLKRADIRAITPPGFAKAFFKVNR